MCTVIYTGFARALEILENPGKFLKPWKSLETPGKALEFLLFSPGKSHGTLYTEFIKPGASMESRRDRTGQKNLLKIWRSARENPANRATFVRILNQTYS